MKTYQPGDRACVIETGRCHTIAYAFDGEHKYMVEGPQVRIFYHSELEPAPEAAGDWDEAEFALACVTPGVEIPIYSDERWDRVSIGAVADHNDNLEGT